MRIRIVTMPEAYQVALEELILQGKVVLQDGVYQLRDRAEMATTGTDNGDSE